MYEFTITFTILSEDDTVEEWPLRAIVLEADIGDLVGGELHIEKIPLSNEQMAQRLYDLGSEPAFFMLPNKED